MLQNKKFARYYLISLLITAVLAFYPVKMGVTVMLSVLENGFVWAEDYPKYVIPYTPISLSVIVGVVLLPIIFQFRENLTPVKSVIVLMAISLLVFFLSERYLEKNILVKSMSYSGGSVPLEGWQLGLCISYPGATQVEVWDAVEYLCGGYDSSFKLHFYAISVVLIVTILSCFYGFAKLAVSDDRSRLKPLLVQTVITALFLGMCIWACFTAFYRTGSIRVSALSATLMGCYFILFGTTMGVFAGLIFYEREKLYSVILPTCLATIMTCLMYAAEMLLLDGKVYRFGNGILFDPIGSFVLAPIDILIILASGLTCGAILTFLQNKRIFSAEKS